MASLTIRDLLKEHDKRARQFRIRNDAGLHSNGITALVEEVGEFAHDVDHGNFDGMRIEACDILNVTVGILAYLYKDDYDALDRDIVTVLYKLR